MGILTLEEINAIRARHNMLPLDESGAVVKDAIRPRDQRTREERMRAPGAWSCARAVKRGITPCEWNPHQLRPARLRDAYHGKAEVKIRSGEETLRVCQECAEELTGAGGRYV
jgi:hypothetical protein